MNDKSKRRGTAATAHAPRCRALVKADAAIIAQTALFVAVMLAIPTAMAAAKAAGWW